MTPQAGQLLMTAIIPIIQSTVPQVVTPIGCDDHQELVQDAIVSACQMADSMEKSGKEILPNSIAYYSIQRTKSGRRSYSGRRTDALSSATILDGNSAPMSLDAVIGNQEGSEEYTIGDMIASPGDDPGMLAAKEIDWAGFQKLLKHQHRKLLKGLAIGERPKEMAKKLGVSAPRISQMKKEIAVELKSFMGKDILEESMRPTTWQRDLQTQREQAASRAGF